MLLSRQNRLLPLLAIGTGLVFLLVLQRACRDGETESVYLENVPQASSPDADTPVDTLNTLTANVAAMTAELEQLRSDNRALRQDNRALIDQGRANEATLDAQVTQAMADYERQSDQQGALADLQQRIDELSGQLASHDYGDLPLGFGLRPDDINVDTIWIEPMDAANVIQTSIGVEEPELTQALAESDGQQGEAFTVPRNATLLGTTAMTALLGRVPVRGEVRDPMPFKVITGQENLAANGFKVPGVAGMIWSGTAIGDWTLSCVTGRLHSVTFVFADGSIKTVSSDEEDAEQRGGRRPLGWISDDHGIPCISGERKSNAAAFLTQRLGAKAVEAAAEAAAAAQTTSVIRDNGSISSAVDGSTSDFILGKTFAKSAEDISVWLAERQAQNFDAVYVPAGASLVIHVDRELAIDADPKARKIHYAKTVLGDAGHRLD